jgi:hypothetical protein
MKSVDNLGVKLMNVKYTVKTAMSQTYTGGGGGPMNMRVTCLLTYLLTQLLTYLLTHSMQHSSS